MKPLALVTAGEGGLGRALALRLGQLGHDVAVLFHNAEPGAIETCALLKAAGADAAPMSCDLADASAIAGIFARIKARFGRAPSVLVNNALCFEPDDIHTVSGESLARHFEITLFAPVLLSQALASAPSGTGLIVSVLEQQADAGHLSCALANHALHGFTVTMAKRLAPDFRVCGIASRNPGPNPDDMAATLEFFVKSPGVTGNVLIVDSGSPAVSPAFSFP
jgi:NAD(P)-dependent dehydrogenase (short-subunit alcohol dehydrogenase family)